MKNLLAQSIKWSSSNLSNPYFLVFFSASLVSQIRDWPTLTSPLMVRNSYSLLYWYPMALNYNLEPRTDVQFAECFGSSYESERQLQNKSKLSYHLDQQIISSTLLTLLNENHQCLPAYYKHHDYLNFDLLCQLALVIYWPDHNIDHGKSLFYFWLNMSQNKLSIDVSIDGDGSYMFKMISYSLTDQITIRKPMSRVGIKDMMRSDRLIIGKSSSKSMLLITDRYVHHEKFPFVNWPSLAIKRRTRNPIFCG